jgi:hypothetical protein
LGPETADSPPGKSFAVEGILVASHPGQVRILLDDLAIDLDESDVLAVRERPAPPHLVETVARAVRLELRAGSRLLGIGSADAYEHVIWRRGHLFAMRVRREEPTWQIGEGYLRLQREFFARYDWSRTEGPAAP